MATSDNLNVLAQKYQELRHISKSSGGDYDEKYQVMKVYIAYIFFSDITTMNRLLVIN